MLKISKVFKKFEAISMFTIHKNLFFVEKIDFCKS